MLRVTVKSFQTKRLNALKTALEFGSSSELFRTLPLAEFQRRALEYIESITPEGKTTRYNRGLGVKAGRIGDQSLKGNWRIRRKATDNSIQFELYNRLETVGGSRGRVKVFAIENGNQVSSYIAKRDFRFFSEAYGRWTRILEGQTVRRPARAGLGLVSKTAAFIRENLGPDIRDRISTILRNRLSS